MNTFKGVLDKVFDIIKETLAETAKKTEQKPIEVNRESETNPEENLGSKVEEVKSKGESVVKLRKQK